MSNLFYHKIQLIRFICSYCASNLQQIGHFIMFSSSSSQNSNYITNLESISLWYGVTQYFDVDKYIYYLPGFLITDKANRLETRALSTVCQFLWDTSWIWFQFSGFNDSEAMNYCQKTMLAIAPDTKVMYSVLQLLISFWEAPW